MVELIKKLVLTLASALVGGTLLIVGLFFEGPVKGLSLAALVTGVLCILSMLGLWFNIGGMIEALRDKFKK